ncbi:hypothetical protein [Methanofollis liminatans]|nr:hypothetical protein [Methanofollis liminatans]
MPEAIAVPYHPIARPVRGADRMVEGKKRSSPFHAGDTFAPT